MLDFDYNLEKLGDNIEICVTSDHKFGTDAFLLSNFAQVKRKEIACDIGTGCGIIPLLWFRKIEDAPKLAYGIDIQEKAIKQLLMSIDKNSLSDRIKAIHADLKDIEAISELITLGSLDIVTCNPPYKASEAGILSELTSEQIARHEVLCNIDDVCKTASKLLRFGGRLCICQRPERLCDVLFAMRQNSIEPKRLRFVQQRASTAPWLFLIEGKKGSKPFLNVLSPLIIEGENGFSRELLDIYQKGDNNG